MLVDMADVYKKTTEKVSNGNVTRSQFYQLQPTSSSFEEFNQAQKSWEDGLSKARAAIPDFPIKSAEEIGKMTPSEKSDYTSKFASYLQQISLVEPIYIATHGASPQAQLNAKGEAFFKKFESEVEVVETKEIVTPTISQGE